MAAPSRARTSRTGRKASRIVRGRNGWKWTSFERECTIVLQSIIVLYIYIDKRPGVGIIVALGYCNFFCISKSTGLCLRLSMGH